MKKYIVIALLALGPIALAHEGAHGPAQKVAPHGGVLRDSTSLMLELVKEGDTVKVYPLTHEGKPIDAKAIEVDSKKTSLTDAKKKPVAYTLVPEGNALLVKFEKGASHRYAFNLVTSFEGKENKANWQIELGAE
jgi:hypothetical protein